MRQFYVEKDALGRSRRKGGRAFATRFFVAKSNKNSSNNPLNP